MNKNALFSPAIGISELEDTGWSLANPFGIFDPNGQVWQAGHVNDVLDLQNDLIVVGSEKGGVWLLSGNGGATPLSDDWDNPDINCLAFGPDGPLHIYAGTASGEAGYAALWMTNPTATEPLSTWNAITLAGGIGSINRIVVLQQSRRIVLGTDSGVWWAPIPRPGEAQNYLWSLVTSGNGFGGRCFGLAEGLNETIVASLPGTGLFHGVWTSSGDVQMQLIVIPGVNNMRLAETSIASCAGDRRFLYAAAKDRQMDSMFAVLSSIDGGQSWTAAFNQPVTNNEPQPSLPQAAGNQGWYNNCIAVSPVNASVVALGWRSGPFLSQTSGATWQEIADINNTNIPESARKRALHGDLHVVSFSSTGNRLYVGSDGGISACDDIISANPGIISANPDMSQSFQSTSIRSTYNQYLANLEFESWPSRDFYGTFSLSGALVAGGLQDNGNVYCLLGSPSTPWQRLADSDGQLGMLVSTGDLLFYNTSDHLSVTRDQWNGSAWTDKGSVPIRLGAGATNPAGLQAVSADMPVVAEAVSVPRRRSSFNSSQWILAVAGVGVSVFGLFVDNDGSDMYWEQLGSIASSYITAVSSYDGFAVFVGTQDGHIFRFNADEALPVDVSPITTTGAITRLLMDASTPPALQGFALSNSGAGGTLLQFVNGSTLANQGGWISASFSGAPSAETFYDIAVDWNTTTVYLATDSHVYMSYSSGTIWDDVSNGLPRRPHCSGLRLEGEMLYLSTFGRSLWKLHVPPSPPPDFRGRGSDFGGGDFGNNSGGNQGTNNFPHRHHPPLAE